MTDISNSFLLVYAGLFPIVNPVGSAPIFLALTAGCSEPVRRALARQVAVNSFLLLLGSLFVGSHVLGFFGITVPVLRIAAASRSLPSAGGCCDGVEPSHDAASVSAERQVDAFYPLTMPLTVGPGSIAVAIALGAQRPQGGMTMGQMALLASAAVVALVAMAATVFLCYRFADRMTAMLGPTGINVLIRLSAFILLCIGIQIIWSGYSGLVGLPVQ